MKVWTAAQTRPDNIANDHLQDIIINERYRLDRKIAEGGFGLVYAGVSSDISFRTEADLTRNRYRAEGGGRSKAHARE